MRLTTLNHEGQQQLITVDKDPDHCPICHHGIEPKDLKRDSLIEQTNSVERVLQCPRRKCGHLFIARYFANAHGYHRLAESVPITLGNVECPEELTKLSTNFYAIYNQAHKAEESGWVLVAGPGYRKALEFLIKDYAIKLHPADEEKIKKMELGPCIRQYVKNDMVKDTTQRAAWLGNDETHYLRKWEGKDLQDLKDLLALVGTAIHSELMYENMKKDMPQGKK